ncbi:MAG: hypothetical protein RIR26_663 [Pseudomonadota bacterium]|jgi:ABC-type nitrate/sulfonate/bicarbonate transport system permease component
MRQRKNKFANFLILIAGIAFLIGLWEVMIVLLQIPNYILPAPQAVLSTLASDRLILWEHFKSTFFQWSVGLSISIAAALFLSWLAFESRHFDNLLSRSLVVSQSVPYLTIAPLLLLWLGLGAAPKIVLILLTCTFPITQLTTTGLRNAQKEFSTLAVILRLKRRSALKHIYAPAALPDFFEGVKISVIYAFVSAVLAELIGSESGLGVYLSRAQSAYRTDRVLAVVVVIVSFSLMCSWMTRRVAQKILFWRVEGNA